MIRGKLEVIASSLIGSSRAICEVREAIARVAPMAMPVLVLGETGTGKELVARALHTASGRSGELVPLNVTALSEALFEDALFGHERGAFSGADREIEGLIAQANGGTLFLDEIGSLPRALQPKLLRVVELREYSRIGSTRIRRSQFRLVTAANESIGRRVRQGTFREDLAHRLRGTVITLPPLRDRLSDIPELVRHFQSADEWLRAREVRGDGMRALQGYHWPGNVRQLRNVIGQAAVATHDGCIGPREVRVAIDILSEQVMAPPSAREQQRRALQWLVDEHADVEAIAAIIGRDPSTVYRHMRHLGIAPPKRISARVRRSTAMSDAEDLIGA